MKCAKCGFAANPAGAVKCKVCGKLLAASRHALPRGRRGESARLEQIEQKRSMLVRAGAEPLELEPGERLGIGRSDDCDLTVSSAKVSREHAEITWDGNQPIARDLGSENGTRVNGRPIREHPLTDGDELAVGPSVWTFRSVSGQGSAREVLDLTDEIEVAALAGRLGTADLFEVLEALEVQESTGTLEVFETGYADGRLIIQEGTPVYAASGKHTGERAVFTLLSQDEGSFRFSPETDDVEPNLDQSMSALLAGVRQEMNKRHTAPIDVADLGDLLDSH